MIGTNSLSCTFFQYWIDVFDCMYTLQKSQDNFSPYLFSYIVLCMCLVSFLSNNFYFSLLFLISFFLICLNSCFSPTPQPLLIDAYPPRPIPVLCLWKLQRMTNQEVWKKSLGKNENKVTSFVVSAPSSSPAVIWELEYLWLLLLHCGPLGNSAFSPLVCLVL